MPSAKTPVRVAFDPVLVVAGYGGKLVIVGAGFTVMVTVAVAAVPLVGGERGDSNPHGFTRQILSLVRLPIPPLSHEHDYTKRREVHR